MPKQMDENERNLSIDFICQKKYSGPCLNLAAPDLGIAPRDSYCLRRAARKINLGGPSSHSLAPSVCYHLMNIVSPQQKQISRILDFQASRTTFAVQSFILSPMPPICHVK